MDFVHLAPTNPKIIQHLTREDEEVSRMLDGFRTDTMKKLYKKFEDEADGPGGGPSFGEEFNPNLTCLWQYLDESMNWVTLDPESNMKAELYHNMGTKETIITPSNPGLMQNPLRKDEYLVHMHKRMMIRLSDGSNFQLRRRQPYVHYFTMEVGADGAGDGMVDRPLDALDL